MFGRRRYYVVEERNNGSGCLIALIIMLVVIAALVMFAWYALLAVIGILLVVGAVIGIFYSIKNNVKAYSDSFNMNRYYVRANTSKPVNYICKAFKVCKDHMSLSWKANTASIRDMYTKSQPYKFFSFNKWMHLFSCMSVAVWGVLISCLILVAYFYILMFAAMAIITVTAIICAIPVVIAIPLALIQFFKNYTYVFKTIWQTNRPANGAKVYVYSKGYRHIVSVFKNTFRKDVYDAKDKLREGSRFAWLSFKRWIPQCTGVLLVVLGTVIQAVLFVLHAVVVTLAIAVYSIGIGFFFVVDAVLALFANKAVSCPNIRCNHKMKRNVYVCDCGEHLKKLSPSTYGIFKKKCSCGRVLPCTVFAGKHKMRDSCPKCGFKVLR